MTELLQFNLMKYIVKVIGGKECSCYYWQILYTEESKDDIMCYANVHVHVHHIV